MAERSALEPQGRAAVTIRQALRVHTYELYLAVQCDRVTTLIVLWNEQIFGGRLLRQLDRLPAANDP